MELKRNAFEPHINACSVEKSDSIAAGSASNTRAVNRYVSRNGETFRVLANNDAYLWLISCDAPAQPFCVSIEERSSFQRIAVPPEFILGAAPLSEAAQKRLALIQPLVDADENAVKDHGVRLSLAKEAAEAHSTTVRRVLRLYYHYLATGRLLKERPSRESTHVDSTTFDWAVKSFYFSAKRLSLRGAYDMMLVSRYTDGNGALKPNAPTWSSFRNYFYANGYHKSPRKSIARDGLTNYQRNQRPVFGSATAWRERPGAYQMDATQADIFLVSRADHSVVIGRPYVYLAVDTATQLIAGVYVGMECDESAVLLCLANAAEDKTFFCRRYGIDAAPEQWPSHGLPREIIADKGREFMGGRMEELCRRYGIEVHTLPPFRPELKGLVEKSFDLIQRRYKPLLRGKGVIEPDCQERWATDYRTQAVLDLDEFTRVILHSIIYLNSGRTLADSRTPAQHWLSALGGDVIDVSADELRILSLPRASAKLTRKGLRVNGLLYVPESGAVQIGEKYTVAYDRRDLSSVFIIAPAAAIRCSLAPSQREYTGFCQTEAATLRESQREERRSARDREISFARTSSCLSSVAISSRNRLILSFVSRYSAVASITDCGAVRPSF